MIHPRPESLNILREQLGFEIKDISKIDTTTEEKKI